MEKLPESSIDPTSIVTPTLYDNSTKLATTAFIQNALNNYAQQIQPVTASVAGNALTVGLNPTTLYFRSSTMTTGVPNVRTVPTAISLTVPSGASIGTINATQARLVIIALDNAGTVELGIVNLAGGNNLDETTLISTTAISGAAATPSIIYSTAARTNVPFRVVGFVDITEATGGTWATAPIAVQGVGGQALTSMSSLGYGQTAQNLTASRAVNTTYYNTTGKPIWVSASVSAPTSNNVEPVLIVNGVYLSAPAYAPVITGNNSMVAVGGIVPPGASYGVGILGGAVLGLASWAELR